MDKKFDIMNNYYCSLTGESLTISQVQTIRTLEYSDTAYRHKINNSLPKEYLQNALVWHDIFVIAYSFGYTLNSGYRCEELNKKVGGVPTSLHQKALACDFNISSNPGAHKLFLSYVEIFLSTINMQIKYSYKRNNMLHIEIKYK